MLIGNKDYWGNGYAGEALRQLLEFVFKERGMNRVEALVLEDNIQSIKMLKRIGYRQDGILRQSVYKNGGFKNQIVLSILASDFI